MAPPKSKQPEQSQPEPLYPAIEGLIEKATAEEIEALFAQLKKDVADLKGPKAELGKKVARAVERTQELLSYLLQVREKLQAERKGGGKGQK
jgi:hypothetical protein